MYDVLITGEYRYLASVLLSGMWPANNMNDMNDMNNMNNM